INAVTIVLPNATDSTGGIKSPAFELQGEGGNPIRVYTNLTKLVDITPEGITFIGNEITI
ncbi:MAG: hypothetical protein GTO54_06245, partial [Nitrososphaeria archaeon]|nr:hypothetical protein [Nitrososphaeria archaeon]